MQTNIYKIIDSLYIVKIKVVSFIYSRNLKLNIPFIFEEFAYLKTR